MAPRLLCKPPVAPAPTPDSRRLNRFFTVLASFARAGRFTSTLVSPLARTINPANIATGTFTPDLGAGGFPSYRRQRKPPPDPELTTDHDTSKFTLTNSGAINMKADGCCHDLHLKHADSTLCRRHRGGKQVPSFWLALTADSAAGLSALRKRFREVRKF